MSESISKLTFRKALIVNAALEEYFTKHPHCGSIPAKDLMPYFIAKGIFSKDQKEGLPIRRLLRELDDAGMLELIPYTVPERKAVNTSWYFTPVSGKSKLIKLSKAPIEKVPKVEKSKAVISTSGRDEHYIIDLCDEVIGKRALRQYTFDFLRGDAAPGKVGKKLPVDAYYTDLNLVIEYRERQHTEKVAFFDRRKTVSGVFRGEQRKIYDERRKEILPKHGIKLIEISYDDFDFDSRKKIIRNPVSDREMIENKLKSVLKNK